MRGAVVRRSALRLARRLRPRRRPPREAWPGLPQPRAPRRPPRPARMRPRRGARRHGPARRRAPRRGQHARSEARRPSPPAPPPSGSTGAGIEIPPTRASRGRRRQPASGRPAPAASPPPGSARRGRRRRAPRGGAASARPAPRLVSLDVNVCSSRAVSGSGPDGAARVPSSAAAAGSSIRASGLPAASSRIRRLRSAGSVAAARSRSAFDASSSSPASVQLGQVGVVEGARHSLPDGEEQDRRIRFDPPRHELEHLGGRPVQPVRVLDHEESGVSAARSATSPSVARPIRNRSGASPSAIPNAARGASLRVGKEIEPAEQGKQQLVKAREGERRLGQRTRRGHDRDAPLSAPVPLQPRAGPTCRSPPHRERRARRRAPRSRRPARRARPAPDRVRGARAGALATLSVSGPAARTLIRLGPPPRRRLQPAMTCESLPVRSRLAAAYACHTTREIAFQLVISPARWQWDRHRLLRNAHCLLQHTSTGRVCCEAAAVRNPPVDSRCGQAAKARGAAGSPGRRGHDRDPVEPRRDGHPTPPRSPS